MALQQRAVQGARAQGLFSCALAGYGAIMPPRGVKKGTKRARQHEKIKKSAKQQGRSESRAEEIAARTVNKEKARSGESRTAGGYRTVTVADARPRSDRPVRSSFAPIRTR